VAELHEGFENAVYGASQLENELKANLDKKL
jgi:hypothetical protein